MDHIPAEILQDLKKLRKMDRNTSKLMYWSVNITILFLSLLIIIQAVFAVRALGQQTIEISNIIGIGLFIVAIYIAVRMRREIKNQADRTEKAFKEIDELTKQPG